VHCYLEVAETNSVVVEIPKLFLAGEQVRDELVNVNKMPTNLEARGIQSMETDDRKTNRSIDINR